MPLPRLIKTRDLASELGFPHDAMLEKTYGHHHPDFQGTAVRALETRR